MDSRDYCTKRAREFADYLNRLADDCDDAGLEGNAADHRKSATYIRWLLLGSPYSKLTSDDQTYYETGNAS